MSFKLILVAWLLRRNASLLLKTVKLTEVNSSFGKDEWQDKEDKLPNRMICRKYLTRPPQTNVKYTYTCLCHSTETLNICSYTKHQPHLPQGTAVKAEINSSSLILYAVSWPTSDSKMCAEIAILLKKRDTRKCIHNTFGTEERSLCEQCVVIHLKHDRSLPGG